MDIHTDVFSYNDDGLMKLFETFDSRRGAALFKNAERRMAVYTRNVAKEEMALAVRGSNPKLQHAIWIRTFRHSCGFKVSVFPIRNTMNGYYLSRHAQKLRTAYATRLLPVPLFLERGTVKRYRRKVSWGRRAAGADTVRERGLSHDATKRGYTGRLRSYAYMGKTKERVKGVIGLDFGTTFYNLVSREAHKNGLI